MATKKRRAYLLPAENSPVDSLYVCVPVPYEMGHILAFLGQLDALGSAKIWENDEAHSALEIAQRWRIVAESVRSNIDNMIGCGGGMELRQNPDDSCQLQWRSTPTGEWLLAFDYGLCIPPYAASIIEALAASAPPPESPYAPADTWIHSVGENSAETEVRRLALCAAARSFVNQALDTYIAARDGELTVPNIVSFAGGLALALLPLAGVSIFMLIGIALAKAALDIYIFFKDLIDDNMAADIERRERMACYLIESLAGRAVTPLNFYAAFSDASVCMTGDDALVADLLYEMMSNTYQRQSLYEAFLAALGGTTQALNAGAESEDCGCPEVSWCHRSTFDGGDLDDWVIVQGAYLNNRIYARQVGGVGNSAVIIRKELYVPQGTQLTAALMYWVRENTGNYSVRVYINGIGVECGFGCGSPIGASGSYEDTYVTIEMIMSFNFNSTTSYIEQADISGTGIPIFEGCDNC